MWIQTFWNSDMGGDLGPSMFIGSEAETEGAGGPDLPMKTISCHLFPRRKTGTNLPREAIRPSPRWNCLDPRTHVWQDFFLFFLFFACSKFSYHTF